VTVRDGRPEVVGRVRALFTATPQRVEVHFARAVFFCDVRHRLAEIPVHCALEMYAAKRGVKDAIRTRIWSRADRAEL
jgi:hypothetical protein